MINSYQAKYFAYELSKKVTGDNPEKFGAPLMDAKVELNPHQVGAVLFFSFKSPYSKGAILADEVGLGKTIKICSYQFARRKAEEIQLTSWDLVVIDDALYLRYVYKHGNKTAKAIQQAIRDYKKVLLTATPLQNRLDELFGLVSVIDNDIFGDIKTFRRIYVLESGVQDINGLKERLKDVVHRTLRRDVREFVPYQERIPITEKFTPTGEEDKL